MMRRRMRRRRRRRCYRREGCHRWRGLRRRVPRDHHRGRSTPRASVLIGWAQEDGDGGVAGGGGDKEVVGGREQDRIVDLRVVCRNE